MLVNPPEQLGDKEKAVIESILSEKRIGCSIKEALTAAIACLEMLFPGQENIRGLLLKEVYKKLGLVNTDDSDASSRV